MDTMLEMIFKMVWAGGLPDIGQPQAGFNPAEVEAAMNLIIEKICLLQTASVTKIDSAKIITNSDRTIVFE